MALKNSPMRISKQQQLILVAVFAIGMSVCIGFGSLKVLNKPALQEVDYSRFDSDRWKKNAKYDRERCVADLIDRKLLVGLSEQQVVELLGTPDWKKSDYVGYEIRPETASFETLYANIKDGKVSKCELRSNP